MTNAGTYQQVARGDAWPVCALGSAGYKDPKDPKTKAIQLLRLSSMGGLS